MAALHPMLQRHYHVVAQVVEAELVVGTVGDVAQVRRAALRRARLGIVEAADREAEVRVDVSHPLGIASSQVRVHGHQVRALPRQRIQVQRQGGDEGLALARRHLGDAAEMKLDAAHELYVVGHHVPRQLVAGDHELRPEEAPGRDANGGERFGEDLVERLRDRGAQLTFDASPPVRARQLLIDVLTLTRVLGRPLPFT